MGEIAALYYGIAAPFKAISKHSKKHSKQMRSCFEKAGKRGFIAQAQAQPQSISTLNIGGTVTNDQSEVDSLEAELELHLTDMLGEEHTKRLLNGVRRGRPTSTLSIPRSSSKINVNENGNSNGSDSQQAQQQHQQTGSDSSSVCDADHSHRSR